MPTHGQERSTKTSWSCQYPDLSPIQHLWNQPGHQLRQPTSEQGLQAQDAISMPPWPTISHRVSKLEECVNHKRAATGTKNTCKALQERVAKLERKNKEFQELAARKEILYPVLKDFHHRPEEQSVSSGSNHSSDEEGDNTTRLEAAPVMAKLVKSRKREIKPSNSLNPEQIDSISKEFKHPKEMGIGPFLTLMTRKIKLYSLHPLDVISVCSQILMPDEIETMEEYYGKQLGKLKSLRAVQDCNVGLLTVLQKSVGSSHISECVSRLSRGCKDTAAVVCCLEAAPVMAKLVKSRKREIKPSNALNPEQIDRMSKEFKHPTEMGIGPFLTLMTRKIKLYSLHPLDVISVCSQILMSDEIETMEEYYGKQLGKLKSLRAVQDCNVGLLTVLQKSVGSTLCWKRIIECYQGKNEPVRQYTQRFAEVYLVHGGRSEFNSVEDVLNSMVSVVQWADGLTQSMRKVLPLLKSAWRTSTLSELSECLTAYERDAHVKRSISYLLRTVLQRRNSRNSQNKSNSVCHCCGKKGHWARECKVAKWQEHKPQPRLKEEQSSTSGVETSSDSGDSGSGDSPDQTSLNQTALKLATVIVKEEKTEGEMTVPTKHESLNPEQVDCLAEESKPCHQNEPVVLRMENSCLVKQAVLCGLVPEVAPTLTH
ncbi:hypothetical protein NFI96_034350, partial [Prochilodus magdalenae]